MIKRIADILVDIHLKMLNLNEERDFSPNMFPDHYFQFSEKLVSYKCGGLLSSRWWCPVGLSIDLTKIKHQKYVFVYVCEKDHKKTHNNESIAIY